ncbi:MAG: PrsW family glutamic-type intramembrane protease [Anaerolineales bacterium]|jgi:RsiW-degrading membrane proteinase PrsW (M82 family)
MDYPLIIKPEKHRAVWWRILLSGIALDFAALVLLITTGNPNLFPTVVIVGNFLVPVVFVAFLYEKRRFSQLSLGQVALSFFYGGLLGVLAASFLEPLVVNTSSPASTLVVGLVEEFAKILGVYIIARHWKHDAEMDGLLLGAATGMGFAALESSGYAFTAFLITGGSVTTAVGVTLLRGLLAPVGHGVWTAILASVLFREAKGNRFHVNFKVLLAYLLVSLLHGLWDGLPAVVAIVFNPGIDVLVAQTSIALVGIVILWLRYREAVRQQQVERAAESDSFPWIQEQLHKVEKDFPRVSRKLPDVREMISRN